MNFNKVILGGHLTRDPELKTLASGTTLCGFGLASSRKRAGAEETVFIDCTAFGKTAELIQQYFQKGSPILVEGRLRLEKWQDKISGDNRSKISVTVENMAFVGKGAGGQQPQQPAAQSGAIAEPPPVSEEDVPW
jgi:single-strand DNA-binding protein